MKSGTASGNARPEVEQIRTAAPGLGAPQMHHQREPSANSLDAACRALIECGHAVLAGSVSDRTETRIDPWQWLREGMAILDGSTEADD